jgi:hypothetical protein
MFYTLSEEEFKTYRLCRAEIIKLYNNLCCIPEDKRNEVILSNIKSYANILNIQEGIKYDEL